MNNLDNLVCLLEAEISAPNETFNQRVDRYVKEGNINGLKKLLEFAKKKEEESTVQAAKNIWIAKQKKAMEGIKQAGDEAPKKVSPAFIEQLKSNLSQIRKGYKEELEGKKEELEKKLEVLLLPKDPRDGNNVIMEIRGAAGGDEANIFAGDLFRMYQKYFEKLGWKTEIINAEEGTSGGFSQIEFMVKGDSVFSKLKYESGAHRVQRIPETESSGRIHTSTATVAVLPEMTDVNLEINPSDLKIDVYRSGGAGGQSVNTADSAVRITHLPTGVVVTCQNERSQQQNKAKAMEILKSKLYEETIRKQEEEYDSERRSKIGTGDRSEKIRTYNYPQNRLTDHRIGFTINKLDRVMEGELDEVIEALINEDQKRKLQGNED